MPELRDVAGVVAIVGGTKPPTTDLMTRQLASHASPSHTSSHALARHSPTGHWHNAYRRVQQESPSQIRHFATVSDYVRNEGVLK
jgi:hypothetical protein